MIVSRLHLESLRLSTPAIFAGLAEGGGAMVEDDIVCQTRGKTTISDVTPCPARSAAVQMGKSVVAFSTVVLEGGYYQTFQSSKIQPQRILTIL